MTPKEFSKYLALERQYSAHTVKAYMRDLLNFEAFCADEHKGSSLNEMPYVVIRSWIISCLEEGCSNRTVNRKVSALKAYYKFLLRKGYISSNPLAGHRPLKTDRKIEVPFSQQEMRQLLTSWSDEDTDFESLRDRLVVELFYSTGIRRAELIGIELTDLDIESKTLRVKGKRNKDRIIPIVENVMPRIVSYLQAREQAFPDLNTPYLFLSGSGNKIYETLVYRIINKYLSRVSEKVKKSPHILRHTFATHMLNQGADMNSVKELLGHASLASTQVYTHNSIAELKKVHLRSHPRNKK
ncbi:tyrosine-type recombinase/integrase [Robiginitalea aurantiaca]|uniref:Tyrosine-type recombinase/integrase n=1 Tax=Robiginitalea aurantiaca TaxID=3056915 RepID=A0ABT7WHW2_9FLAO|nr:tyrosine-type recombinase/integrase [Robiginitalea aurantiaca]MDM9632394.1 tyrosine-type recombinase/integrase [Robiginitalea aurantiaca]